MPALERPLPVLGSTVTVLSRLSQGRRKTCRAWIPRWAITASLVAGLGIWLSGCETAPIKPLTLPSTESEQARLLLAQGQHSEAAIAYLQLAELSKKRSTRGLYRLEAISAYLLDGQVFRARQLYDEYFTRPPSGLKFRANLVAAHLSLAGDDPATALQHLATPPQATTPARLWKTWRRLRAEAYSAQWLWIEAARERDALDTLFAPDPALAQSDNASLNPQQSQELAQQAAGLEAERTANHQALWKALSSAPLAEIAAARDPLFIAAVEEKSSYSRTKPKGNLNGSASGSPEEVDPEVSQFQFAGTTPATPSPPITNPSNNPSTRSFYGWVELAYQHRRLQTDPTALAVGVGAWRTTFPGHVADALTSELILVSEALWQAPPQVALLLPFSGRFAGAGQAVRDGFLASWYADASNPTRPNIMLKDSAGVEDPHLLYAQAVEAGARFVVGPLERKAVREVMSGTLSVPTLVLNDPEVPTPRKAPTEDSAVEGETDESEEEASAAAEETENLIFPNGSSKPVPEQTPRTPVPPPLLFRFALSPEGEARSVAERAWLDGHQRAVTLVPAGIWGQRVEDAFVVAWEELGGMVVEEAVYEKEATSLSASIKAMLNLDASVQRGRRLQRVLGLGLETDPRRRQDIDFIFMAAFPKFARQLRAEFDFHRAHGVPVYATSHVFTGRVDPSSDEDLRDVVFGDMPWILAPSESSSALRVQVQRVWPNSAGLERLMALGVDAYRLTTALGKLKARQLSSLDGTTGELWVDDANRVQRRLLWARFKSEGIPAVIEEPAAEDEILPSTEEALSGNAPSEDAAPSTTQ